MTRFFSSRLLIPALLILRVSGGLSGASAPAEATRSDAASGDPGVVAVVRHDPTRTVQLRASLTGIVVFEGRIPAPGLRVSRDERLGWVENQLDTHDSVHLFPQRWELLKEMLALREREVEARQAALTAAELLELGTISRRDFERVELASRRAARISSGARQRLDLLDRQIRRQDPNRTPLLSPIDGTITAAYYSAGQVVYEEDPIFEIADLSRVWVEAYLPLSLPSSSLGERSEVLFSSPAVPGREYRGERIAVRPAADGASGGVRVLYRVENPDKLLRAGTLLNLLPDREPGGGARFFTARAVGGRVFEGEVRADPLLRADVTAPLWGRLELEEGIAPGARVAGGQGLARIVLELSAAERLPLDDRTLQIERVLEQSRQKLDFSLRDYQRAARIGEAKPDFLREVERRRAIHENALEEHDLANRQRARQMRTVRSRDPKTLVITAPRAGVIEAIHFRPGELNPTGQYRPLFTIVDLSSVLVRAQVYGKDLERFRKAHRVEVRAPVAPGLRWAGTRVLVADRIDEIERTVGVDYRVPTLVRG